MPITPGIWEVAKGGRSVNVGRVAKCRFEAGLDAEELAANCRLIAAAPKLLAALEAAFTMIDGYREGSAAVVAAARDAIAKARG